jgi:hypothetical protein
MRHSWDSLCRCYFLLLDPLSVLSASLSIGFVAAYLFLDLLVIVTPVSYGILLGCFHHDVLEIPLGRTKAREKGLK